VQTFFVIGGYDFVYLFSGKSREIGASLGDIWAKMMLEVL